MTGNVTKPMSLNDIVDVYMERADAVLSMVTQSYGARGTKERIAAAVGKPVIARMFRSDLEKRAKEAGVNSVSSMLPVYSALISHYMKGGLKLAGVNTAELDDSQIDQFDGEDYSPEKYSGKE